MTLTEFLLARITEDERWQGGTNQCAYDDGDDDGMHYNRPRVLAECEAKRRIVELHYPDRHLENWYWTQRKCAECGGRWHRWLPGRLPTEIGPEQGCPTLRLLALPYAAHSDYQQEWKP